MVSEAVSPYFWVVALVIVTAAVGIPIRLYLVSGAAFRPPGLRKNFLKLFPAIFLLDMLWALAPFLLVGEIGFGLALGSTAALLYSPFAQRSLMLMATADSPGLARVSPAPRTTPGKLLFAREFVDPASPHMIVRSGVPDRFCRNLLGISDLPFFRFRLSFRRDPANVIP